MSKEKEIERLLNTVEMLNEQVTRLKIEGDRLIAEAKESRREAKRCRQYAERMESKNIRLLNELERLKSLDMTMSDLQKTRYLRDMELFDRSDKQSAIIKPSQL